MKKLLATIPALLLTVSVHAEDGKRLYGGFEYGVTRIDDNAAEVASIYVAALGGSARVTQDASAGVGRVFFGYRLTPQTAFEGGYFSSQTFGYRVSGTTSGAAAYTSVLDIDYSGVDAALVWSPMAVKNGDTGFYLKAGAHSSKVESTWSITGAGGTLSLAAKETGTGMLFGAGYDWRFSDAAFVRAGATRYLRLAGDSDNKATVYSVAFGLDF